MHNDESISQTLPPEEQEKLDAARELLDGADPKEALRGSINNFWCNLPGGSFRRMAADAKMGDIASAGYNGRTFNEFFADVDTSLAAHGLDPDTLRPTMEELKNGSLPEPEQEREFAKLLFPVFEDLAMQGYPVNTLKS